MAQTISYQRGTLNVTPSVNYGVAVDPVLIVTAPSTGVSRVIISQFALRCTVDQANVSNNKAIIAIGQDSTGYSYIGGSSIGNTPGNYVAFPQVLGTTHAPTGSGYSGTAGTYSGSNCAFYYNNDTAQREPYTSKNLPADVQNVRAPGTFLTTMSSQIWVVPNDRICLKLSGSSASNFEVVYSFIFITET